MADDDRSLLPLLECLTSISQALGGGFSPFVAPVFSRCVALINRTLQLEGSAASNGGELPDRELVVCALDLISGMTEGMGKGIEPHIKTTSPRSVLGSLPAFVFLMAQKH